MDPREILTLNKKIRILIDTNSLDKKMRDGNQYLNSLLKFDESENIEIIRMPCKSSISEEFIKVKEMRINFEGEEIKSWEIGDKQNGEIHYFGYRMKDIIHIGTHIYKKETLAREELDNIITIFIQATLEGRDNIHIMITDNDMLLNNRLWFENHFPGGVLNIMTIEETVNYIDLYLKYNKKYFAASRYRLNKGLWYLYSMRLKLPYYNVGDELVNSLSTRVYYSLMAIDEIGIQYYLGPNNDTLDNMLYHFGYFISLVTGIFDNLALKTNIFLGINEKDLRKVSLTNDDYLKEIRSKNQPMRDLIANYMNFIKLIYCFRELIIHREGLKQFHFSYRNDIKWEAGMIDMDDEVKKRIDSLGNDKLKYDPFTVWGTFDISKGKTSIEPYQFTKQTLKILLELINQYLILFGYSSFIENQKKVKDEFTRSLLIFEENNLGI